MTNKKIHDLACKGCIYLAYLNGYLGCCDYIFKVGKRRPCPPGKDCTVKEMKRRKSKIKQNKKVCETRRAEDA